VISMWDSDMDYRLVQKDDEGDSYDGSGKTRVYFVGGGDGNDENMEKMKRRFDKLFRHLTRGSIIGPVSLDVQGREVIVPRASEEYNIARFSFHELCGKAKGAADYLAIGERFHTVFIENVPKLHYHEVNLVRRWITLIDALYENHVKLVIQAETSPDQMFQVDLENEHCDEVFAFDRTRSRLEEMRSENYLRKKWRGHLQFSDDVDRARRIDYMQ
jgi:predicted ATPase